MKIATAIQKNVMTVLLAVVWDLMCAKLLYLYVTQGSFYVRGMTYAGASAKVVLFGAFFGVIVINIYAFKGIKGFLASE